MADTGPVWRSGDPRLFDKLSNRTIIVWTGRRALTAVVENHAGWTIEVLSSSPEPYLDQWPANWLWTFPPNEV